MSKKQITELASADSFDEGDLMLVRKSGAGVDRKLTKDKLVDSLGSSVVNGYQATSEADNKINLTAANKAVLKAYADGMHICFISPIASDGVVELKIDSLPYIKLEKYNSTDTAEIIEDEYIEAVYSNGAFKQTNKLNTNLVWSSEYTATAEITGTSQKFTHYKLSSAVGVKKPNYYDGMVVMFVVPEDSQGVVLINVDGLSDVPIGDGEVSFLNNNDFYKNRLVQLVYKKINEHGGQFLKYTMPVIEEPEPIKDPDPEIIPPVPTIADDPAAAENPNAVDSQGEQIFKRIVEVGQDKEFKTIVAAITKLRNEYGDKGGGNNYAILLTNYSPPKVEMIGAVTSAFKHNLNLDWISIFSQNNAPIALKNSYFRLDCNRSPIFHTRFNVQIGIAETNYLTEGKSPFMIYGPTKLILGKNFECIFQANVTGFSGSLRSWMFYVSGFNPGETELIAKYGYKFTTNLSLGFPGFYSLELNNGDITLQQKVTPSTKNYGQSIHFQSDGQHIMSNTIVHSTLTSDPVFLTYSPTILKNVNARARNNNTDGIHIKSYNSTNSLTMEDCTFNHASSTNKDVVIDGTKDTRIYLKNTVVSTNQEIGIATNKGLIQNIE